MREVAHGVEMQKAGRALEGVKGAKDRIDRGRVGGILLEHEDTLLNALQQFRRLAVEFSQKSKIFWQVEVDRWLLGARRYKGCRDFLGRSPALRQGRHRRSGLPG